MSWENEDYKPNKPISKHNPLKNLRALTETSKDPLARLPYGPNTNVLRFLTGQKIKAVKNTPAKLLFSQKLSKMLPKGQTQRRRNLMRKENEEALEPFFRQFEQERKENLSARKRSAEKTAFNKLMREGTTLPTSSYLRAKASQNRKKAKEKSRRRRGHSTSHKTQKKGR